MKREVKTFLAGAALSALVLTSVPTMAERVSKTAELFYNDIKVVINGNRADLKDAAGNTVDPFVIDGTTYLPVRAVANALDQAVSWDAKTQTVYIGKNDEISQPSVWVKDLESFTGRPVGMSADALEFGVMIITTILPQTRVRFSKTIGIPTVTTLLSLSTENISLSAERCT